MRKAVLFILSLLLSLIGIGEIAVGQEALGRSDIRCYYRGPVIHVVEGRAVLLLAGYGGDAQMYQHAAKILSETGVASLRCDFATGDTEQANTARQDLEKVVAAYDWLAAREEVDPKQIGVIGTSLGSLMAIWLSSERSIAWEALHAPAVYSDEDFGLPVSSIMGHYDQMLAWREKFHTVEESATLRAFAAYRGPTILFESDGDESVRRPVFDSLLTAKPSASLRVVAGAWHVLTDEQLNRIFATTLQWLEEKPITVATR